MRKIFLSFVLIAAGNFALPAAWGQNGKKMELVLEHEEKFSSPKNYQLAHVVFGKDNNGNPIPRILVTAHHVEFRDKNGSVIKKIPYTAQDEATKTETHLYTTRYGKNIAVHVTHGYSPVRESWETGEYSIYDENGNETLRLRPFNDDTMPSPSPSGDYAVGYPNDAMMGPPNFYDAKGTRNEKWARRWYERAKTGFKSGRPIEEWPDEGIAGPVRFSPDGKYAAVFCTVIGSEKITIVYDSNGDKLFQKKGYPIIFSSDGKTLFYSDETKTSAAGMDGHVIWTSTTAFLPEAFSRDGQFLIARKGPAIYEARMTDGRINWKWEGKWHFLMEPDGHGNLVKTNNADFGISYVAIAPNSKIVAAIGIKSGFEYLDASKQSHRFIIKDSNLFIFDSHTGRLLAHQAISRLSIPVPTISIAENGNLVSIQGQSEIFYLAIHSGKAK